MYNINRSLDKRAVSIIEFDFNLSQAKGRRTDILCNALDYC